MSLEPLLGPFQIQTDGIDNGFEGSRPFWLDNLGLCGYFVADGNGTGFKYQIVQYDGVAQVRNNSVNTFKKGHLTYDFQSDNLTVHSLSSGLGGDGFSLFDAYTGNSIAPPIADSSTTDMWTRYFDRYLRAENGRMYSAPLSATSAGALVQECLFPFPPGRASGLATISDYGGGFLSVGFIDGDIWIYDPANLTTIGEWKTIDLPNAGLWYSKRFNVFISMHALGIGLGLELRVWANETRPFSISDPIALQELQPGRVSEIQVQVLGSAEEPVKGQLVEFSIGSGDGALVNEQALTDEEGYAIAQLAIHINDSGSTQIDAETNF